MSNRRVPQAGQMGGAVRVGALERTLEEFNSEVGQKVAASLGAYHAAYVAPMEARLAALETPWWKAAWLGRRSR